MVCVGEMIPMPRIVSVGTALPPNRLTQREIQEFVRHVFQDTFKDIDRLLPIFDNGQVKTRHLCMPLEWYGAPHHFSEKNHLYRDWAYRLGIEAIRDCLTRANLEVTDIDHLFFVSTTGISTPSMDALIMNGLNMDPHMKRTPIWGLGCAGGAVGLTRASDYLRAYPENRALLVAVETCSLTFQPQDTSKSNLIGTSLFADGAAAVLLEGDKCPGGRKGPKILFTSSTLWKGTEDVMGWDVNENGLKVIFSRDIPVLTETLLKPTIIEFLTLHQLNLGDIAYFITHPGGYKVIEAYASSLGLPLERFHHPLGVLQDCGNMSSASVLFVLQRFLREGMEEGKYGIITALGPGFSSELLLLEGS
jgi:alkylresorcinol/alkylpyrone synthase